MDIQWYILSIFHSHNKNIGNKHAYYYHYKLQEDGSPGVTPCM